MTSRPTSSSCARARATTGLLAVALGLGWLVSSPAARAETAPTTEAVVARGPSAPASPDLPGLPDTSIELSQVPVDSPALRRAVESYGAVDAGHTTARDERANLDHTRTVLTGRIRELEATRAAADARTRGLRDRLDDVEAAVQELAVQSFVAGDEDARTAGALASETPAISEVDRKDVLGGLSMDVLLTERTAYLARIDEATERADDATAGLREARQALRELTEARPAAVAGELDRGTEVAVERVSYEEARVLALVDGVEFPLVALDAYYRAATSVSDERPECRVQWWGLAGISRVEGRHGTYGGATLEPNGDTSRPIIGIQLNGTNDTAVVGDSDGGTLDGDPAFDRAVGPMQFIPQTWQRFQADGNEDGTISPFNMYDATLAAARYLCTSSSGLDADPGLRAAYFSYNHSLPYVDSVLGHARRYEHAVEVPAAAG